MSSWFYGLIVAQVTSAFLVSWFIVVQFISAFLVLWFYCYDLYVTDKRVLF